MLSYGKIATVFDSFDSSAEDLVCPSLTEMFIELQPSKFSIAINPTIPFLDNEYILGIIEDRNAHFLHLTLALVFFDKWSSNQVRGRQGFGHE